MGTWAMGIKRTARSGGLGGWPLPGGGAECSQLLPGLWLAAPRRLPPPHDAAPRASLCKGRRRLHRAGLSAGRLAGAAGLWRDSPATLLAHSKTCTELRPNSRHGSASAARALMSDVALPCAAGAAGWSAVPKGGGAVAAAAAAACRAGACQPGLNCVRAARAAYQAVHGRMMCHVGVVALVGRSQSRAGRAGSPPRTSMARPLKPGLVKGVCSHGPPELKRLALTEQSKHDLMSVHDAGSETCLRVVCSIGTRPRNAKKATIGFSSRLSQH